MCVFRGTQKIFRVKMNSALYCQAPKRSQRLSIRLMHCNLRSYDALCKGQTETFINVMWNCILSGLPSMQMQMQSLNMQSRELRSIDIGWQGCKHFYKWFFSKITMLSANWFQMLWFTEPFFFCPCQTSLSIQLQQLPVWQPALLVPVPSLCVV